MILDILNVVARAIVLGGLGFVATSAYGLASNYFRGQDVQACPDGCECDQHVPAEELLFDEAAWRREFDQEAVR